MLERLVARAGHPSRVVDWRTEAFRVIAPGAVRPSAIAATIVQESSEPDPAAWACIATPVHLSAGMRSVSMAADGILNLAEGEATELSVDFNRVFDGSGTRLPDCGCGAAEPPVRHCRRCADGARARIRSSPPSEVNANIHTRRVRA